MNIKAKHYLDVRMSLIDTVSDAPKDPTQEAKVKAQSDWFHFQFNTNTEIELSHLAGIDSFPHDIHKECVIRVITGGEAIPKEAFFNLMFGVPVGRLMDKRVMGEKVSSAYLNVCGLFGREYSIEEQKLGIAREEVYSLIPDMIPNGMILRLHQNGEFERIFHQAGIELSKWWPMVIDFIDRSPKTLSQREFLSIEEVLSITNSPKKQIDEAIKLNSLDLTPAGLIGWAEAGGHKVNRKFVESVKGLVSNNQTSHATKQIQNSFKAIGEVWEITFNGRKLPLIQHVQGLDYIQRVLKKPGEIIPNWRIEGHIDKPEGGMINNSPETNRPNPNDRVTAKENVNQTMTPEVHKAVLEERQTKEDQLQEKIRKNDPNTGALEKEIEQLNQYLSQNTYKRRIKNFTSDDTKISDRIRKAIGTAINKIHKHDQSLAELLTSSIKTSPIGTQYTPLPGTVPWEL